MFLKSKIRERMFLKMLVPTSLDLLSPFPKGKDARDICRGCIVDSSFSRKHDLVHCGGNITELLLRTTLTRRLLVATE